MRAAFMLFCIAALFFGAGVAFRASTSPPTSLCPNTWQLTIGSDTAMVVDGAVIFRTGREFEAFEVVAGEVYILKIRGKK